MDPLAEALLREVRERYDAVLARLDAIAAAMQPKPRKRDTAKARAMSAEARSAQGDATIARVLRIRDVLREAGTSSRDIASIIARRTHKSPAYVREILAQYRDEQ